jgi:ABC-2 type transport system ATP-binding protein
VYELNLEVPRGCVFAFLGRNGSGKSTTIRMLLGLLPPTRGGGAILGADIRNIPPSVRARVGYLTEEHQLYNWMTVRQICEFQSSFFPRWNDKILRGVLGHFGLRQEAKVRNLSRGQRGGLSLALTLAPDPELLILDDPALGLDPVARRLLVESMIYLTRRSDRTIFFSSHQLSDVERVADYVAVMDHSVLRAACSLEAFRERIQQVRLTFNGSPPPMPPMPGLLQAMRLEKELRVTCVDYNPSMESALRALNPLSFEMVTMDLEEAFISYLGDRGERSFILSDVEVAP